MRKLRPFEESARKNTALEKDWLMSKADRRTRFSSNPWGEPGHERHCTRDEQCKGTAVDDQSTERLKVGYVHSLALLEITFACSRLSERVRLFVACALASEGRQ